MLLYWDNEYALLAVVIFAVSKEVYDLSVGGKLKDSVQDIIFQVLGGILCLAIYNQDMMILESVIIISVLGLFLGVVPRIKAAL
jgi:multisubunit Na+/H+ antiporter MnhF subunit